MLDRHNPPTPIDPTHLTQAATAIPVTASETAAADEAAVMKKWFPLYKPLASPRLRILCFPNAGSAENIYTGMANRNKQRAPNKLMAWAGEAQAEVLAVQYPGRENRRGEPFVKTCQEMAAALLPVVRTKLAEAEGDGEDAVPFVFVSHSCGNWVAYELLRLLRRESLPLPKAFFVSCMASPDIAAAAKPWKPNREMGTAQLQAECKLWDVNEAVFHPSVWPTFEPLLRADFTLFDQYTHGPERACVCTCVYARVRMDVD